MLDYDPSLHQGLQSEAAKSGLMIAWMLIPGILLLVSGFSILFYPLDGEGWKETKRKIAEKHAEKEANFKQNVEN
jgi:Na+/melibiose symporter-like transporter